MIQYFTSTGERVSEAVVQSRYQRSRERRYSGMGVLRCWGCGTDCNGSAHIIAKARCKVIHKTELIWAWRNFFPACSRCNQAIENPKGEGWKKLTNIYECLQFIEENDRELYQKFYVNRGDFPMKELAA